MDFANVAAGLDDPSDVFDEEYDSVTRVLDSSGST
jgi:hypothetical protein